MSSDLATKTSTLPTYEQFTAIRRFQGALAFSPDGSELAYSVNTSGQYNLWRQASTGGYPHQITLSSRQSVREISWSPDGATFAFTADQDGDEFTKVYQVPVRGGQPSPIAAIANVQYHMLGWSPDGHYLAYGANDRVPEDQDIVLWDAVEGRERRLLASGGLLFPASWSPDSRTLLAIDATSNTNMDILAVDIESGEARLLTEHEGEIIYQPVGWTADGAGFYLLSNEGREFTGLAYLDLASGTKEWIATPEWDVEQTEVSKDGSQLVWSVNEDGYSRLYMRDLRANGGSDPVELPLPDGVLDVMALAPAGNKLGVLWARATHPVEVLVVDLATRAITQVTESFLGGIDESTLAEPQLVRFPTFDGRQIPAFLYRSPHQAASGKQPVLLSIHGGPEAQERPQYMYSGLYQYLASRGIAVLAPNVRGSTGYGKTYQTLIHHDWGGNELKDFEAAVTWLRDQDWVDPDRIGVFGGSFGGFATLSCVSRLPDYWAAAVDIVGPSNLVSFAKAVPPTWRRMMAQWVGDPETEKEFLLSRSPVTYVDQIRTPLFVIQGANDPRVVKPESDQIVEQLRARGIDVRYDVYDDEGHGFTKRENELKAYRDVVAFLEAHLLKRGA